MLRENRINKGKPGQDFAYARMFSDRDHLLSVYFNTEDEIIRFVYVEGLSSDVRSSLTWSHANGLRYSSVDSGESSPLYNRTPIITGKLKLDPDEFLEEFLPLTGNVDTAIVEFIEEKLRDHSNSSTSCNVSS